jgi:hypothetical protein
MHAYLIEIDMYLNKNEILAGEKKFLNVFKLKPGRRFFKYP